MQDYPTETKIILLLKERGELSLFELAQLLNISKMGVLNHINHLEERGLLRRIQRKGKVGRPYYLFSLTEESNEDLANSDRWMLQSFLQYLKETGNSALVENFLKDRYAQIRIEYEGKLRTVPPGERVKELVKLREGENYFPELKEMGHDGFELQEFNCPIYQVSKQFGIACKLETTLFSSVLDRDVESTHRQVDGSGVCRFLIRPRRQGD